MELQRLRGAMGNKNTTIDHSRLGDSNSNGKNGQFGSINVRNVPSTDERMIGEGRFNFCVVDSETGDRVAVDFNFFFFDLDNRRSEERR